MQWLSFADFLNMGGYAFYVWGSFGVTALVAVFEIWQVRALRRNILQNLSSEGDSLHNTP
jgi:heme exporter protein D